MKQYAVELCCIVLVEQLDGEQPVSKSRNSFPNSCMYLFLAADARMASAVERTDDLLREYLIYRGFTSTLKHLDAEIKADKEKGFRVSILK